MPCRYCGHGDHMHRNKGQLSPCRATHSAALDRDDGSTITGRVQCGCDRFEYDDMDKFSDAVPMWARDVEPHREATGSRQIRLREEE